MLDEIFKTTFSSQDVAFALQHGNFTAFVRNLTRSDYLLYPRVRQRGPGGGIYRYPHVVEMALQMSVGTSRRSGKLSRALMLKLHELLHSSETGLKKLNALPEKEKRSIFYFNEFDADDFPRGAPHDLAMGVSFPFLGFGPEFISRDLSKPTYLLYDPAREEQGTAKAKLITDTSSAYADLVSLVTEDMTDERDRAFFAERVDDIGLVNLSALLVPIDRRLDLRLEASKIRGA